MSGPQGWDAAPVSWECWTAAEAGVGETPIWSPGHQALYWGDILGPTLSCSAGPGLPVRTWKLPDMLGSYALTADERHAVVALSSGIHLLDLESDELVLLHHAPYDPSKFRFNDGRCDPAGRFWSGTSRQPGSGQPRGSASFYRLDDRGLSRQFDGITIANGLAFSPDGATMYVADSVNHRLLARNYDLAEGVAGPPRIFAELPDGTFPDGAVVDADGFYWIAMYGSGVIVRFAPDGREDRVLQAPVTHPTMVAFGGPGASVLFVTTARRFVEPALLETEPLAGAVFCADVGVTGALEPRFVL